ncbi:sac3 ganp nin1 mts3 eif-3 p25 protein, partial [Neofusicoccum parvum]
PALGPGPVPAAARASCREEAFDRASGLQEPVADAGAYVRALELAGVARGRAEALFLAGVVWPQLGAGVVGRLVERVGEGEGGRDGGWVMEVPEACLVCLEEFGEGGEEEEPVRLACGHVLGERCARRWLRERNTCVVCRGLVYRYVPRLGEEEGMDLAGPDGRRVFVG